jgi:hypothetical protein
VKGDVSIEWVELEGGSIVCRDRDNGETHLQFDGPEDYRERDPSDAPATVHYDAEDSNYVVERGGKVERKYGAKGPLTDGWSRIYEPVIPEAMFCEHGHDSVPEPEAFRIAIVPNDDRDLVGEPELLMFDSGSEAAVPIDAWLDGSTDGVETGDCELEESDCDDAGAAEVDVAGDCGSEGDDSPAVEPLRGPKDPAPAPEPPDPEQLSEAPVEDDPEETSEGGDDRDTDSDGVENPFSSV